MSLSKDKRKHFAVTLELGGINSSVQAQRKTLSRTVMFAGLVSVRNAFHGKEMVSRSPFGIFMEDLVQTERRTPRTTTMTTMMTTTTITTTAATKTAAAADAAAARG